MRTKFSVMLIVLSFLGGSLRAQTQDGYWEGYQLRNYNQPQFDRVVIELGTIGLVREKPDSQVLAFDENLVPIFDADQLQGSMEFGFKAMLDIREVRPWFGGTDLQLGYFGINSLDADETISANEVNAFFFGGIPTNPPTTFDFLYSSNLYSGEANLRFLSRRRVRPLVGLRYFKLEDTYDVTENSGAGRDGFFSLTNNSLIGGQLGMEADFYRSKRLTWYGFGKVAAMHNDVEGTATSRNAFNNFDDSNYATLVDAGTGASFHFVGPLSFKVGYRSLFVSDLALGIDQNEAVSLFDPTAPVRFNSQHWHGVDFAAVFEF